MTHDLNDDGFWYEEHGVDEPFATYFRLSEEIRSGKDIHAKLAACEASYKILWTFVNVYRKDFGRLPDSIPCRDVGVELYLRLGQWDKARAAIELCAKVAAYDDHGKAALEHFNRYKETAELAIDFLRHNEGFLQKNIYKALPDADKDCLKSFVRSSLLIRKEKAGSTNKLYVREAES